MSAVGSIILEEKRSSGVIPMALRSANFAFTSEFRSKVDPVASLRLGTTGDVGLSSWTVSPSFLYSVMDIFGEREFEMSFWGIISSSFISSFTLFSGSLTGEVLILRVSGFSSFSSTFSGGSSVDCWNI